MKTTDMKTIYREKIFFYTRYSKVANLQVTDVRVNKIMSLNVTTTLHITGPHRKKTK